MIRFNSSQLLPRVLGGCGRPTQFTLPKPSKQSLEIFPETIMEVEYSLFVEQKSVPRGHVPLPCLLDVGGHQLAHQEHPHTSSTSKHHGL